MRKMLRNAIALGAAGLMGLGPVAAFADTSLGVYQTTDRKMDYALALCGTSQQQLCVTLTAARGDSDTPQVHPFLGKYVIDHARPVGKNRWKGSMTVSGYTANGTLTLDPGNKFVMHGCVYVLVCTDFMLIPAKK